MESKETQNISTFFTNKDPDINPEKKWELIFEVWLDKIDRKKLMPNLFEVKLWFEGLEEYFASPYLENLLFKYQTTDSRNYQVYVNTFSQITGKIINHLKTLDFDKDQFFLNFEEFIVEKFMENYTPKSFPYLKDVYSPESWFYSLRIFLQNIRNLAIDLAGNSSISLRTFSSLKRLYRKELMDNSIIISLLKGSLIPKMDKVYQPDVCEIIASIEDKKLRKDIGIFFIIAFRILKINDFIIENLNKNRNIEMAIPLILVLKKNLDSLLSFYDKILKQSLSAAFPPGREPEFDNIIEELQYEYKKMFSGEVPYYFESNNEKVNKRKLLKNVAIISDFATQHLILAMAKIFREDIAGDQIFANFISRERMALDVQKKLKNLYAKINSYLAQRGEITSADIFFEINLFIETDLIYLLYKDWHEFLQIYNHLLNTDFTPEFKANLRDLQAFIARILKEIAQFKTPK